MQDLAGIVVRLYPHATITIDGNDYHYAMLYRLKPPNWANDALILAFCARLCSGKRAVRVVGIEDAKSSTKRGTRQTLKDKTKTRAVDLAADADALMVPLNFGNTHWCGIIADLKTRCILYYDSINLKIYKKALDHLSWDLARTLGDGFQVVCINAPI